MTRPDSKDPGRNLGHAPTVAQVDPRARTVAAVPAAPAAPAADSGPAPAGDEWEVPPLAEQPARRRRAGPLPVAIGVFFTILIHGVVVYAAYYAATAEDDVDYTPPTVIDARLLKFGKTITSEMLPHKPKAPPPPPKKVVGLSADGASPTRPSADTPDTPDPKDEEHTSKDPLLDSLTDFDKDAKPGEAEITEEGTEEGVKGGTITDPKLARAIDKWNTALVKLFRREWGVTAGMTKAVLESLVCEIHVDISRSGEVSGHKRTKDSGNELFDAAAMAAATAVKRVPDELMDRMPKELEGIFIDGFTVRYKGSDL